MKTQIKIISEISYRTQEIKVNEFLESCPYRIVSITSHFGLFYFYTQIVYERRLA